MVVTMIGVVLWSDARDGKAVFWCEDQGDLAYYEQSAADADRTGFFDAGDMVQFEIRVDMRLRKALNAQLVQQQVCADLPDHLRRNAGRASLPAPGSAQIIPFAVRESDTRHQVSAITGA